MKNINVLLPIAVARELLAALTSGSAPSAQSASAAARAISRGISLSEADDSATKLEPKSVILFGPDTRPDR